MEDHVDHVPAKPQIDKEKANLVVETSKTRQQRIHQRQLALILLLLLAQSSGRRQLSATSAFARTKSRSWVGLSVAEQEPPEL